MATETLVALDYDNAFPTLIRELLPIGNGIKGFVLAAIFGAVVSSIAAMLNSASTIFAIDIYNKLRGQHASQYELVTVGRIGVVVFVLIAMIIAPSLGHPKFGGIFTFIQEFQGFISSGILAIFLFGVLVHRAPRYVGTVGLILNPVLYGIFKFSPQIPGLKSIGVLQTVAAWSFLDRMAAVLRTDHGRVSRDDARPPAGPARRSAGEPQDGHDDVARRQGIRRDRDPVDDRAVRDLLVATLTK